MSEYIHNLLNKVENEQNEIDHDLEVEVEPDLPTKIGFLVLEMLDIYFEEMGDEEENGDY